MAKGGGARPGCAVWRKGAGWNGLGVARHGAWPGEPVERCPPPLDKLIVVLPEMGRSFSELQRVRAYGTASAREFVSDETSGTGSVPFSKTLARFVL